MDQIIELLKYLLPQITKFDGAFFCLLILSMYVLLPLKIKGQLGELFDLPYQHIATVLLIIFILISVSYLVYPNYIDHLESTVAVLGSVMQRGDNLYPIPDPYPYHGVLYGPALAEIQFIFQGVGLPTIIASKIPGILAFSISILILFRLNKTLLSRGYLLYLLPFGLMLFWNRADPFLLLIVSLSLLLGKDLVGNKYLPLLFGFFAGAASALKLHGAVYLFAVYLAVVFPLSVSISSVLLFSIFSVLSFLAFFIPQNVSINTFMSYIIFASVHGLSLRIWLNNFIYIVFLFFPILVLWRSAKLELSACLNLILILGIELFITVLASKPGSGIHHLLPFIPINAFIILKIGTKAECDENLIKLLYVSLIIPSLVTALTLVVPMLNSWRLFDKAQKEVVQFEKKYPGIVMGLADKNSYQLSFLRVVLRNEQIDYPAFMDLQYSGVSDNPFAENLNKCRIKNILLPKKGIPFSMTTNYSHEPLFSNKVREAFKEKFTRVESGEYFMVYMCSSEARHQ